MLSVPLPLDDRTLDLSDPEATGAWIAEALDRLRVRTTQAIMAVPRAKVILKPVILPPVDDFHELGAMVKLQVSRDLPFAEECAIIDFTVQSHYASGGLGDEQESVGISDGAAFQTDTAYREGALVATLAREVGRSLQSYDGMAQQRQVQHVLIAGDTGLEERVVAELDGQLGLSCERFDPGENLKLSAVQREDARGAVSVIGMASRAGSMEELPFDFLNPRRLEAPKDHNRFRKKARSESWHKISSSNALRHREPKSRFAPQRPSRAGRSRTGAGSITGRT